MIIHKSKINWIIGNVSLTAFDRLQATTYYAFTSSEKESFNKMKESIISSKPEELNNWIEVICLARENGMIGYGTRLKREWFEES